jgi:hypothetical protein
MGSVWSVVAALEFATPSVGLRILWVSLAVVQLGMVVPAYRQNKADQRAFF